MDDSKSSLHKKESFKLYTSHIVSNHQPSPYLRRFRLPSLNSSPTTSYEDLISPDSDIIPFQQLSSTSDQPKLNEMETRNDPNSAYRKALEELELARQSRPRLGSTSDYFSMTGSTCSDMEDSDWSPTNRKTQLEQDAIFQLSAETAALERRNQEIEQEFCDFTPVRREWNRDRPVVPYDSPLPCPKFGAPKCKTGEK